MFRKFTFRSLVTSLLAVLALGIASQAVAQTRIMPLGDSITAAPGCWRAYLWSQLQGAGFTNIDFVGTSTDRSGCGFAFDVEHEGHSGFSITGIADQNLLPAWLTSARPSIVIVHLGTNDMWGHFITLQTKLTALTKLIGQMRAHNANMKIIVAQIIPMDPSTCTTCNADVIEFNNALPAWSAGLTTAQSPITLVNQFTGFNVGADTFDRVHPVDSGFRKMAAKFFPAVTAALAGTPPGSTLTVTRAGAGTGTVMSSPAAINCGAVCSASFSNGASVTLSVVAAGGSTFAGWSGACSGTGGCTVSMTQARSVTATFNVVTPTVFPLAVTRAGTATGTVTSNPAGINCGTTCTANYTSGTSVTLSAAPAGGATFTGWSGACTGIGACTVSMTQARNVTATFQSEVNGFVLTVMRAGAGTGVVTSSPAGINCGTTCSATFGTGTSVTLTAQLASNSTFAGWSGACSGTGTCTVSMTQARSVTATFNAQQTFALNVTLAGTGTGVVTSSPAAINCGSACSANFGGNASVTLTATPATGATFAGWSGACTGTGSCVLTMNAARAVTATFNGGGGTGGSCPNPITFSGNTGNFNTTGAVCYRTNATVNGWGCFNVDGRTVTVGGVARTCGQMPLTRSSDGFYYFAVTAGQFPWAGIFTW